MFRCKGLRRTYIFLSIILWLGLAAGRLRCGELVSLEELIESATRNNIRVKLAEKDLDMFKAESSLLNNLRATSSYNFETQTYFYGVTFSVPFGYYQARKANVEYKKTEIERVKSDVVREIEDLYLRHKLLAKEEMVYRIAYGKAELRYELAQEDFKYDRILKEEFIQTEKELMKAFYDEYRVKEEIESVKRILYEIAGCE